MYRTCMKIPNLNQNLSLNAAKFLPVCDLRLSPGSQSLVKQINRMFEDNLRKLLLFLHKNLRCGCGYSSESPQRGNC